jgi:hypothetical protein
LVAIVDVCAMRIAWRQRQCHIDCAACCRCACNTDNRLPLTMRMRCVSQLTCGRIGRSADCCLTAVPLKVPSPGAQSRVLTACATRLAGAGHRKSRAEMPIPINHKHVDAEMFTVREDCGGEQDLFHRGRHSGARVFCRTAARQLSRRPVPTATLHRRVVCRHQRGFIAGVLRRR